MLFKLSVPQECLVHFLTHLETLKEDGWSRIVLGEARDFYV
jgi:hypothetical protein